MVKLAFWRHFSGYLSQMGWHSVATQRRDADEQNQDRDEEKVRTTMKESLGGSVLHGNKGNRAVWP